ncbi:MAG: polysaccharide biosynthesis tyrosine autokinase [Fibrobacterota bacterium]|nr:polysaccharide biosynthesis tyrosine autokinase [Fibrobacterota bacterium]
MNEPVKGQRELAFGDYFRILFKGRYILLFSVVSFLGPTWWFIKRLPDFYITSAQLVMDEKPINSASVLMGDNQAGQKSIGFYRTIFQSRAFLDRIVHATAGDLAKAGITVKQRDYISSNLGVNEGAVESFVSISSKTNSPDLSYALVKVATDSLIVFCRKVENEEANKAIDAIKEQIDVCIKKRDELQIERNKKSDISKLQSIGDAAGLAALEKNYQDELVKFELDKANLEAKRSYFRSLDNTINSPASGGGNEKTVDSLRAQMKVLDKEKEKMMRLGITLTPDSKLSQDMVSIEGRLVKLTKGNNVQQDIGLLNQWQAIRKEIISSESEQNMKRARLDAFKRAIINYREGHPKLGQEEFELTQIDNLLTRYISTHQRLSERLEDAVIHMESKSGGLKLVDAAQVPTEPIPRRDIIFYAVSLVVGLALGIGLSILREFLDDTVKSPDDVEKQLALTLLGTIPHINPKKSDLEVKRTFTKGRKQQIRNKYPSLMMGAQNEESVVAEAYRSLRTNIVFSSPDKAIQTLIITSSGPGEGKSLTMANTALSFAQQGEPTLVIDTDLRRPVNHHLFGFDRGPGFGELFAGTNTIDEVCREIPGTNLKVMTAGAYMPNPAELLGSKKMDHFLDELKKRYRYILFDTPPVIAVTDAAILATKVDGVVLVIRANKTSLTVSLRTLQALRNVNARVLGCILNDIDITKGSSSYGYYKHYYHNYLAKKD